MSYPKLTPIVATGGSAARYLGDRFNELLSPLDFGAAGNGSSDDTDALLGAVQAAKQSKTYVNLAEKTYKVTSWPDYQFIKNGYIVFQGKESRAGGSKCVEGNVCQEAMCKLRFVNADGTPSFTHSTYAPQGIAYLNVNGVDKIYVTVRTVNPGYDANQMCRIAEYNLREDGAMAELVQVTDDLPIGHGQGFGAQVDSEGEIYFYMMEAGVPNRYRSSNENFGKGFTKVHYKGSSTQASDCVGYRLLGFHKAAQNNVDPYVNCYFGTPTLSPDGKHVVLLTKTHCFVYSLEEVLDCTTEDVDYTWSDANDGSSNPIPSDTYIPLSTRINATSVKPEYVFYLDTNSIDGYQGVACDNRYIYVSSGTGNPQRAHCIQVYTYDGFKVKDIWYSGAMALYTEEQIAGLDNDLQLLVTNENEGVFVKGDELCVLSVINWRTYGDIVTYNGKNYACVASNTGAIPDLCDAQWLQTSKTATSGAFNPETSYTQAGASDAITQENSLRFVTAIKPNDGDEENLPIDKNGMFKVQGGKSGFAINLLNGGIFAINSYNPQSGETRSRLYLDDNNLYLYEASGKVGRLHAYMKARQTGSTAKSNYTWFQQEDIDSTGHSGTIKFFGTDDSTYPGRVQILNSEGTHIVNITKGFLLNCGANSNPANSTGLQLVSGADVLLNVWASSSGMYYDYSDRNVIFRRSQGGTLHSGVWMPRGAFSPIQSSPNTMKLGTADEKWSEVFASTGTINTSDARHKTKVADVPSDILDAWGEVDIKIFKFIDAVEKKGEHARIHAGIIAQEVQQAFASKGLDASAYGFFCYDEWDYREAEVDEDGNVAVPAREAGNIYGIRYEEALVIECAFLRSRISKMQEQIDQLTEAVARLTSQQNN